jgi:glycine/sarcosine N-methyltransferase
VADPTTEFYDRLAADYALIYEDWPAAVERQAALLDRLIRERLGPPPKDLLDCACGIGTQVLGLAALGYRVTGSDLSARAIERAKREAGRRKLAISFEVADMRALEASIAGRFDVVLAADNALPHLASDADLATALRAIRRKLAPDGLFLASIRDYDDALAHRPVTWPARLYGEDGRHRIVQQVWEWLDDRRYRVHVVIMRQVADDWRCDHHVGSYRALTRGELSAALRAAGFEGVEWLMPAATGFHQPLVRAWPTAH